MMREIETQDFDIQHYGKEQFVKFETSTLR